MGGKGGGGEFGGEVVQGEVDFLVQVVKGDAGCVLWEREC